MKKKLEHGISCFQILSANSELFRHKIGVGKLVFVVLALVNENHLPVKTYLSDWICQSAMFAVYFSTSAAPDSGSVSNIQLYPCTLFMVCF